ncbi:sterol desaturase family protein [Pedobacter sp. UBA4863]|uniref:sterol desaturase family protein n=1 Tax=Pedobacter sp. UBA4863 TaxID=1947060 RepID=UPI0025E0F95F|nr:sterol desaturase family protein [Pedobacter sp. UBA4863]
MVWIVIACVVATFIVMEAVAWLAHKYLMHGFLWYLHQDHHKKDDGQVFEKNDFFFVLFATPAIILFLFGSIYGNVIMMSVAGGITLYGFCYFMVHDIFIHQRFKWFRNTNNIYLKAIRRAHKMHHKHLGKHQGECFGMLWVPFKYFREAYRQQKIQEQKS